MFNPKMIAALVGLGLVGVSNAQISAWKFVPGANQNTAAGRTEEINAQYDAPKGELSYSAKMSPVAGKLANSFWLVINDGPMPRGTDGEYAIFYFDGTNASAPKLTAYAYNGQNADNSYKDGSAANGLQTPDRIVSSLTTPLFTKSLSVTNAADGTRTLSFVADVRGINAHTPRYPGANPWDGAKFGAQVGAWFHPMAGTTTSYENGFLKSLNYSHQGSVDVEHKGTQPVPEPASMAALALGAVGLLRRRAKKQG